MGTFTATVKYLPVIGPPLLKLQRFLKGGVRPVQGNNNQISNDGIFRNVKIRINGNNNQVKIGRGTVINNALIFIKGNDNKLIIDESCFFGEGELWIEDNNCSILIHEKTTIEKAHLAVTEDFSVLEIHKDCMLARHVEIRTGDSHSIIDKESGKRINKASNVTLYEHVWVGAHAKILKGVVIGNNTVIGTASLVTTDIPSNSIAAGVPAKVIRSDIDWKRERINDS